MGECTAQHPPDHYLRLLRIHHPSIVRRAAGASSSGEPQDATPRAAACTGHVTNSQPPTAAASVGQRTVRAPTPKTAVETTSSPSSRALGEAREQCPHCSRMFSQEAAARHIRICAGLKNRPKPPAKEQMTYFTDALGRRQESRPGTSSGGPSIMSMNTPTRSSRRPRSATPGGQAATSSGSENHLLDDGSRGALVQQWDAVQFLLRDGLDAFWDDAAITATARKAEECVDFLQKLEEAATRLGVRKGALSRMLLPFNSETNSGDQADSALESALGSHELDGLMSDDERRELVASAVMLRKLIRVKVADCADVDQAHASLRVLISFLQDLRRTAESEQRSMTSLLREL